MKRHHKKILRKLSQQEAEILALRFGVKTEKPQTLQECGEQLGLDRQRVRQIEARESYFNGTRKSRWKSNPVNNAESSPYQRLNFTPNLYPVRDFQSRFSGGL